jgi:hypothetical protein
MFKNKFFLAGLIALGWIAYKKIVLAKKIIISVKDFSFNGGNFLSPVINVKLQIENPTDTTADIQKISADILLQNKIVGVVYQDINQKILANQKTIINFDVRLNLENAAIILISNKFKNQTLELNGNILVDFLNIPFNYSFKLA